MSLATNVTDLATRIASEVKTLRTLINGNAADLSGLTTTAKGNLVAAINEIAGSVGNAGAQINDSTVSTLSVWSSSKTDAEIDAAVAALVSAAPGTLDTLNELAAAIGDDPNFAATLTADIGNRVRFDAAQGLTGPQQVQARSNIGAGTSNLVIGTTTGTAADAAVLATSLAAKANTASPTFTGTVSGISKAMVGLGNVDNTSDASKPVSTATATALAGKANTTHTHLVADITDASTVGKAVLAAADAPAARSAIGAGTSSLVIGTTSGTAADAALTNSAIAGKAATTHTHTVSQLSDATTIGKSVLVAADAAAVRTAIGAGTGNSNLVIGTTSGTAADAATLATSLAGKANSTHTHVINDISNSTTVGKAVMGAADAAAARTAIGAGTSSLAIGTTASTAKAGNYAPTAADISNASTIGRTILTAASAAAVLTAINAADATAVGDTNTNFVAVFEAGLV